MATSSSKKIYKISIWEYTFYRKYAKMYIQSIIGNGVSVGVYFFVNNHS